MTVVHDLRAVAKLLAMAASVAAARMVAFMLLPLFPADADRYSRIWRSRATWDGELEALLNETPGLDYVWGCVELSERAGRWSRFALIGAEHDDELKAMF